MDHPHSYETETRDYLAEARRILAGETAMIPQLEHLKALQAAYHAEVDEFNEGFEAFKNGVRYEDLEDRPNDMNQVGWAWAAFQPERFKSSPGPNERISTHGEGCWRSHHGCAIAMIERLSKPTATDSGQSEQK
jgi:hypothetical protein